MTAICYGGLIRMKFYRNNILIDENQCDELGNAILKTNEIRPIDRQLQNISDVE